jgi:hypothetical protein
MLWRHQRRSSVDDEKINNHVVALVSGLVYGCDYEAFAYWAWGEVFRFRKGDLDRIRESWNERHGELLLLEEGGNVLRDLVHMTDLYNDIVERKIRNIGMGCDEVET